MQKRTVWCNILEHRMGTKLNLYGNDALSFGVGLFFFASKICLLFLSRDLITYCNDYDLLVMLLGNALLPHCETTWGF